MIKTVRSFFIVELRTSLPHKLSDSEYSDREQAEIAHKALIKMHPKARIREQEAFYDLRKPEELLRYKAHLLHLKKSKTPYPDQLAFQGDRCHCLQC